MKFKIYNLQANLSDWWLRYLSWNCPQMNVNIGSGNDLVPSGGHYQSQCWPRSMSTRSCILTHWGRVTHIYLRNLTIIGSDNGLSLGRRQAIIWTNAWISIIEPLGTYFSEIAIGIQSFSFKKMHFKMSVKWHPFCLCLNVLKLQRLEHYIKLASFNVWVRYPLKFHTKYLTHTLKHGYFFQKSKFKRS